MYVCNSKHFNLFIKHLKINLVFTLILERFFYSIFIYFKSILIRFGKNFYVTNKDFHKGLEILGKK